MRLTEKHHGTAEACSTRRPDSFGPRLSRTQSSPGRSLRELEGALSQKKRTIYGPQPRAKKSQKSAISEGYVRRSAYETIRVQFGGPPGRMNAMRVLAPIFDYLE